MPPIEPSIAIAKSSAPPGRAREHQRGGELLAAAAAGQGGLLLIAGEAGIGKTTLLRALAASAHALDVHVAVGRCDDLGATPPYGPWLDARAHLPSSDGAGSAEASASAPAAQLGEAFTSAATRQPLLLALEDLHWADPASIDLLRALARRAEALPLLIVATYRADELRRDHPLHRALPSLAREAGVARMELRRLDGAAIADVLAARYALAAEDAARLQAFLEERAEGQPFFMSELLRALEETGALHQAEAGGWRLGSLAALPIPRLVAQVIDERVERLGEPARASLAAAAVLGIEVTFARWAAVSGQPEEELAALVERASAARLLEATADGGGARFVHALTRHAIYAGASPARRRVWHRQAAEALLAEEAPDPDDVANHLVRSGDPRAADWLIQAGDRAYHAYAWATAAERLNAAADLLAASAEHDRGRGWLRYRVGRLLRFVNAQAAIAALADAERLGVASGDAVLAAYAHFDRGLARTIGEDVRLGVCEAEAGLVLIEALPANHLQSELPIGDWIADARPRHAGPAPAPAALVAAYSRRGSLIVMLGVNGRIAEARRMGEAFLDATVNLPPDDLLLAARADAWEGLAMAAEAELRVDDALEGFRQARALYQQIGHHVMTITAMWLEFSLVLRCRTTDRAARLRLADALEEEVRRAGGAFAERVPVRTMRATLLAHDGEWAEARALARAGTLGHIYFQRISTGILAELARLQGDRNLAWAEIGETFLEGPATEPGGMSFTPVLPVLRTAAALGLDAGDLATARAWLEAHDRWLRWAGASLGWADGQVLWSQWHRATGDLRAARAAARAALAAAQAPEQPLVLLAAHRLLGELEAADRRIAEAEPHLRAALDLAAACHAPYERALTLIALAEARRQAGRQSETEELLAEAEAIALALGARPALERIGALRAGPPALVHGGLSAREVEVLRLVADGLTDAEVAGRLSISPRTVGQHLRSVYAKLNVPSRAAATRYAVEHRLV